MRLITGYCESEESGKNDSHLDVIETGHVILPDFLKLTVCSSRY